MKFYYHPILGLQYNYIEDNIILDMSAMPNISVEKFFEVWYQCGLILGNTLHPSLELYPEIKSNSWL